MGVTAGICEIESEALGAGAEGELVSGPLRRKNLPIAPALGGDAGEAIVRLGFETVAGLKALEPQPFDLGLGRSGIPRLSVVDPNAV